MVRAKATSHWLLTYFVPRLGADRESFYECQAINYWPHFSVLLINTLSMRSLGMGFVPRPPLTGRCLTLFVPRLDVAYALTGYQVPDVGRVWHGLHCASTNKLLVAGTMDFKESPTSFLATSLSFYNPTDIPYLKTLFS